MAEFTNRAIKRPTRSGSGRMRSALRGPHSNIDPWESAEGILNLLGRLQDMPYEWNFYDYRGIPYPW